MLYVIRVQSGKNLLDTLEAPSSQHEELLFQELLRKEGERLKEKKTIEYNAGMGSNQNLASTAASTTGTLNRSKDAGLDEVSNSPTKSGSNPNISRSVLDLASANPNILYTSDGTV